jgi:hypothetical protein
VPYPVCADGFKATLGKPRFEFAIRGALTASIVPARQLHVVYKLALTPAQ